MNFNLLFFGLTLAVCSASPLAEKVSGARQKRLLFYDEEGNLVKTYKNPHSVDFIHNAEKVPFFGSIFSMFRPSTLGVPTVYMIPVSDQVIQQINTDPVYQNKLFTLPRKDLVIEPNSQCAGKRTQIPSKSCQNFLNCWDGWAFEQECPEGLLFSKDGYCDYPHNVDCGARMNEQTSAQPSPQCSNEFEATRSDQHCNEFFVCVDRVPVWFRCPSDLVYNEELGVCDYAYRVNCEQSASNKDQASPPKPGSSCSPTSTNAAGSQPSPQGSPSPGAPASSSGDSVLVGASPNGKTSMNSNTDFSSQTWSSIHLALSRQDAIRQLKLRDVKL